MNPFFKACGVIAIVVFVLAGCGNADVKEVKPGNETATDQTTDKQEDTLKDFYKIGETVSVEGMEITVTSAKFTEPNAYTNAQNGKVMTVLVTIKNASQDNGFVDNTEFVLSGASGTQYVSYYGYDDANLFTAELKKGNKIDGKLAYDVGDEDEYTLYYEPSFTLKENAEIKFKITKADLQ